MAVVMHFATFLKFLTLNTGDKIRDLEKYAQPGGYDFYRPSRDGVFEFCAHGRSRDKILKDIEVKASTNSVSRNVEVFENVANWLDKQSGTFEPPSRGVWASPSKVFSIHIEPEICFVGNTSRVVAVYPRIEPRLNRDQAGAGVLLLQRSYRSGREHKFGILDAYGSKAFWTPTNVSDTLLDREIEIIESELSRVLS